MHEALRQPELLTQIFEWLSVPTIDDPARARTLGINRKACLTAAPTCRLFLSPALDVIWKTLPELTPLIALIPGLKNFSIADKPILCLEAPLINHHLELVKGYAKRVKHLTIPESTTHDPQVHPSVLASVHSLLKASPLFPSLHKLDIHITDRGICAIPYQNLLLFVSPTLRNVSFQILGSRSSAHSIDVPDAWHFFHALLKEPPSSLRSVTIQPRIPRPVIMSLGGLTTLRHLHIRPDLSHFSGVTEALQPLTTLSNLTSLSLDLRHILTTPSLHPNSLLPSFSRLESLRLEATVNTASTLFSFVEFSSLTVLDLIMQINSEGHLDLDACERLFLIVARQLPRLCYISLDSVGYTSTGRRTNQELSWPCISPLGQLNILHFSGGVRLKFTSLSDDNIAQMLDAWPNLGHISLRSERTTATVTFKTLITVATKHPLLRHFRMSMDLTGVSIDVLPDSLKPPNSQHALNYLDLYPFTPELVDNLEQPHRIIEFIDALFPHLDSIVGWWYIGPNVAEIGPGPYIIAHDLLTELRRARKEGREMDPQKYFYDN